MQCMPCPLATNVQVIDVIEQRCQACTEIIDSCRKLYDKFSQNNKKLKANMHTIKCAQLSTFKAKTDSFLFITMRENPRKSNFKRIKQFRGDGDTPSKLATWQGSSQKKNSVNAIVKLFRLDITQINKNVFSSSNMSIFV